VAAIAPTAITCNTTHFAPHAVRFAALEQVQAAGARDAGHGHGGGMRH
jgi:hypothetical protein